MPSTLGLRFLSRWIRSTGIELGQHEPGFLGPVPYILLLRYFVAIALALRFWLHRFQYTSAESSNRLLIVALIAAITVCATGVAFSRKLRRSKKVQALFVLVDIVFISIAYILTRNPESDFFLFYYLPIFAAVEYLGNKAIAAVCILVACSMGLVLYLMQPLPEPWPWTTAGLLSRVLVPRAIFFLAIVLTSAFVFRWLSERQAELSGLLDSLRAVSAAAVPSVLELDRALDSVLSQLTDNLHFEFAVISLVDEYQHRIESVRGRNVPPGWISRSKFDLGDKDILADVVRTGRTEVISERDKRFNEEIYERFGHSRLARVFAPIVSEGRNVGTIEASCPKERQEELITKESIAAIQRLGLEEGDEIARSRPHVLLEMIAARAIRLIGADSASLHVYRRGPDEASAGERGWGELILAAGAGRATHEFVREYRPRSKGMGRTAVQERRPQALNDSKRLRREYPALHAQGARALATLPLTLGSEAEGVLAVFFCQEGRRFTQLELNLTAAFARQMEVVIQNYLQFRSATDAAARAWAVSSLEDLMQSITSPFHLPDVLNKVAQNALLTLDADNAAVYQYHAGEGRFDHARVLHGRFFDRASVEVEILPGSLPFRLIQAGKSRFVRDVQEDPELAGNEPGRGSRFVEREKVKSCAIGVMRPREEGEIVGLIFLNFREPHEFSPEEKKTMEALATSAALAIRIARLHETELARRKRELDAMRAVDKAIVANAPNLRQVMQLILQRTLDISGGETGKFMLVDRWNNTLESAAWLPPRLPAETQKLSEGIIGLAARERRSVLVGDVKSGRGDARYYKETVPETKSELAVPLVEPSGDVLGVLNLESSEPDAFSEDDRTLMETLAVQAVIAVHSVELYKKLGRRIRHLASLNLISALVQETRYELDAILRLFLAGVTAGGGLGFSRAMLFLADGTGETLRGELAIGAISSAEANKIWKSAAPTGADSLDELETLLRQAAYPGEAAQNIAREAHDKLTAAIRRISLRADGAAGSLAECLQAGKTRRVKFDQSDASRPVLRQVTEPDDLKQAFVCVPLAGKQIRRVGVLVVDNRFLLTEREIDDEDVAGLEAYAGLLSLSIENARLQDRLSQEQRVANWREVSGGIAHALGNPIDSIDGKVTRIGARLDALAVCDQEVRHLLERLTAGVNMARTLRKEFLSFTASAQLERKPADLREILIELLEDVGERYKIDVVPLPEHVIMASVDSRKLGNAIMEVIKNALESSPAAVNGWLMRAEMRKEQPIATSRAYARIEIADRGPGIDESQRQELFKPFFTTKRQGTGLGLAIAKSVIDGHEGTIEAENNAGGGARFIIRIPLIA